MKLRLCSFVDIRSEKNGLMRSPPAVSMEGLP